MCRSNSLTARFTISSYLQGPTELHCICILHYCDAKVRGLKKLFEKLSILHDLRPYITMRTETYFVKHPVTQG